MSQHKDHASGCFAGFSHFQRKLRTKFERWREPSDRAPDTTLSAKGTSPVSLQAIEEKRVACSTHYLSCCDYSYDGCPNEPMHADVPPSYEDYSNLLDPQFARTIDEKIKELDPALRKLSLQIHDHPELMFEERFAHDTLTSFMFTHGFTVTRHYLGLETAWRAEWSKGSGGRVIGINSEMDALPEIGHACGHNLIAMGGVAIALALKAVLENHDVPGKIILLGTPAEESGGGKVILLEKGAYKKMDVCLLSHPTVGPELSSMVGSTLSMQPIEVEYFGHSAHAGAAPWEGRNALDAAFLAYSSVAVLRQQVRPENRIHGVIQGKADMPANVIPDYCKMLWVVRTPSRTELEALRERIKACLEAAAMATACSFRLTLGRPYYDQRNNLALAGGFADAVHQFGFNVSNMNAPCSASTDFGNVTYELPAIQPSYGITTTPGGGNHTPEFAAAARTMKAHEACLTVAKALTLTGFRVLYDDTFYHQVKQAFDESKIKA